MAYRPLFLFPQTVHEACDRGGYYEQADFAAEYGSLQCIVKLGCWGPVVLCNVPKRGWINGVGGCPRGSLPVTPPIEASNRIQATIHPCFDPRHLCWRRSR